MIIPARSLGEVARGLGPFGEVIGSRRGETMDFVGEEEVEAGLESLSGSLKRERALSPREGLAPSLGSLLLSWVVGVNFFDANDISTTTYHC